MTSKQAEKFKNLRIFNAVMGVVHLFQAILMFVLSNSFSLPVKASHLVSSPAAPQLTSEVLFNLRIGPMVGLFLLISAVAHFLVSTVLYRWYVENLKNNINYIRWVEYAFSASIMIVVIAMLTGIFNIIPILLIFAANGAMILFGWMMELHNQNTKEIDWTPFVFGCLVGIAPWIAIAIQLAGAAMDPTAAIPDFVIGIYISIGIFFNIFALNQFLQYKGIGPWGDYLFGEKMYVILSLVAKSALAWQVFTATLM